MTYIGEYYSRKFQRKAPHNFQDQPPPDHHTIQDISGECHGSTAAARRGSSHSSTPPHLTRHRGSTNLRVLPHLPINPIENGQGPSRLRLPTTPAPLSSRAHNASSPAGARDNGSCGGGAGGGRDHRRRGAVGAGGGGVPVPARRARAGPGARRLRGLAVAEARLRPAPPPPRQAVQRAPARAAPGVGADVPPPRRLRGVPGRVRGAVRRPHQAPPRGRVGAVRPRHRAVGGRGRRPRHGPDRAVHGEVPGGGVRGERREVRARGARARGVPGQGDARRRVPVGGGDEREGRARRRLGELRHGDRVRPRGRRRRHLHRRPQRAAPGDQGDLERGDGAVPVPAGVGHRQAGAAHVLRRVRRHVPPRPPPPRRGALHHEAHHPGVPRRRRRHLRQDQVRRDPRAPRRRQERPRQRRRVRGRETAPLRRHRLRHRLPEQRQAVAQERGRADRRRRDGGAEPSGALEGGERAVLRGDGSEGHLRQLRGRRTHRRRHQQAAAAPPPAAGPGQRLLAPEKASSSVDHICI